MTIQLDIFVHTHENNHDSKRHLEENRNHFSAQCQKVLRLLRQGKRLTVKDAIVLYNIGDLRRRCKDLKDYNGINIKSEWVRNEDKTRYKIYFL